MYTDLYNNVIPERFPVHDSVTWNYLMDYAGVDTLLTQYYYDPEECAKILEKSREIVRGDNMVGAGGQSPIAFMFAQNRQSEMGPGGMIQHPEREYMYEDEYDELIKAPYDFYLETVSPRQNLQYAKGEVFRTIAFAEVQMANMDMMARLGKVNGEYAKKYGYWSAPMGSSSHQYIPFDFIADHCRGFSKIPIDIRRQPEKVLEACDALLPFCIWSGYNPVQTTVGANSIPTHMAAFLKTKDFEKFYWPTFKKVVHKVAERGQAMSIFIEQNWDRYVDYLTEMPMGTRMYMEQGNEQLFKDQLGKKHILAGFYPLFLYKAGTKQQCIDEAKRIVDILAPGGNYYFCCGKSALVLSDINPENYIATMEWLQENNKYDNAGEIVNPGVTRMDTVEHFDIPEFKSKYFQPFEEFEKEFPPVAPRVRDVMKAEYEKYFLRLGMRTVHNK